MNERYKLIENVNVYTSDREIIITGMPAEDDETHNCDWMGCTSVEHVLYRASLGQPLLGGTGDE